MKKISKYTLGVLIANKLNLDKHLIKQNLFDKKNLSKAFKYVSK